MSSSRVAPFTVSLMDMRTPPCEGRQLKRDSSRALGAYAISRSRDQCPARPRMQKDRPPCRRPARVTAVAQTAGAARPPSEDVASVHSDGARLIRQVADTRAAAALVIERQRRVLVGDVVDIGGGLPALRLQPEAQVGQRVARQLRVEV